MSNVYGPSLIDFVCLPTNTMQANFCRMFFNVCVCERESWKFVHLVYVT